MSHKKKRNIRHALSPRQLAANQQNAQQSCGPKTEAGKTISSQNAITHGGYANRLMPWEDADAFDAFYNGLWDELAPDGPRQEALAHDFIWSSWRLRRLHYEESLLYQQLADNPTVLCLELSRLSMVEVRVRRAREKALKELHAEQGAQAMRTWQAAQMARLHDEPAPCIEPIMSTAISVSTTAPLASKPSSSKAPWLGLGSFRVRHTQEHVDRANPPSLDPPEALTAATG